MNLQSNEHDHHVESITPSEIVLSEEGNFPRPVIIRNKKGETKIYHLVKTKFDCLILNK
jgi:hypothetical protein